MGLFSRVRRLNGSPAAEAPAAEAPAGAESPAVAAAPTSPGTDDDTAVATLGGPPRPGGANLSGLRDALQQLYAIRPSRDAYAEEAIKLIARAAGVKAAALLSYETRGGRMRLLAHTGLDGEATQVLSGDQMVSGWDIPLRALRNRRINVIEAAHENPFVPRALVALNPRRLTIAALPFFHANAPIGALVLFSPTARGFADGLLKTLSQGLRVCAAALSELPLSATAQARVVEEQAPTGQPNLLRGLAALKAELARLTEANEEADRQRATEAAERVTAQSFLKAAQDRAAALEQELAELRASQQRVPEIEGQVHELNRRLASAAEAADAAQSQVATLQRAVAEHEARATAQASSMAEIDAQRQALEQQLHAARETARARGEEAAALHAQVAELAPRAAQAGDLQTALAAAEAAKGETDAVIARLRQELLAAHDHRTRAEAALEQASTALAANESERQAIAAQLEAVRAELVELERLREEASALRNARAELEAAVAARAEELATIRASQTASERERAAATEHATARIAALEAERERLAGELPRLQELVAAQDNAVRERGAQVVALEQALAEARGNATRLESERGELSRRLDALSAELASAATTRERLESELRSAHSAREALATERRDLLARVESLAAGGQTLERERHAAVVGAERRVAELEAEIGRLSASLESTRSGAADELTRTRHDAESVLDSLRVDLAETARARDELQRALATAQQESAGQQRALAEMSAERARLEALAEQLGNERKELGGRLDASGQEARAVAEARAAAEGRAAALEAEMRALRENELAAARAALEAESEARRRGEAEAAAASARQAEELAALRDELTATRQTQERLAQQLAEKDLLLQSAEENLGALELVADADTDDDDTVLAIERDAAPERAPGEDADLITDVEAAVVTGELILLDGDASAALAARKLAEFGHRVSALTPGTEAADGLKQRSIAAAAVNLVAPGAWTTLRHLRNGSGIPRMPLVAYALAESANKGFWLGPVDFAILPVAQLELAPLLNKLVPRVKRVLAMSNDIDVMSDVRTQLTGAGISTAVVLDGRQALDLVPTIRPEAAVLHLSPSCVDVFRAIAGLRAADSARDIPILFLLDEEAQPREEAFLTAGVRMLTGRGALQPEALVDALASAFDGL
jgi:CheY-like chemotaxis protein/predicted  nucleic acid-binding Zn-ribbon protein